MKYSPIAHFPLSAAYFNGQVLYIAHALGDRGVFHNIDASLSTIVAVYFQCVSSNIKYLTMHIVHACVLVFSNETDIQQMPNHSLYNIV